MHFEVYIRSARIFPANNMALQGEDSLEFYDGEISIRDAKGEPLTSFPPREFRKNISEASFEWTLARFPFSSP